MGKSNLFGDVRAENDQAMLDESFYETQNYHMLFESKDRFIVVGRRGTGKSALTYKLSRDWENNNSLIVITPEEEQVFGLRTTTKYFGDTPNKIKAGIKLCWRYALIMEIALVFQKNYKLASKINESFVINKHLIEWKRSGDNIFERIVLTLKKKITHSLNPDEIISSLNSTLDLNKITSEIRDVSEDYLHYGEVAVIIDRLDEGYEADNIGVGIVNGIIYGTDEVRNKLNNVSGVVFVRDNIFRMIQKIDNDYTRNIEGQVLRLHWDVEELFHLVCKRIIRGFNLKQESNIKAWNTITENELHGREAFKSILRFTLYRPRDIISLLNHAFENAKKQTRSKLIREDFIKASKQISSARLDDLKKEYESVFPGIRDYIDSFINKSCQFTVDNSKNIINAVVVGDNVKKEVFQHFKILGGEHEVIKTLYSIGFWGIKNTKESNWGFSYDGKITDLEISDSDVLMIHPCYWDALNLSEQEISEEVAGSIYDEYEIKIYSHDSEKRKTLLGRMISQLKDIPEGQEGANDFEEWCKKSIEIAFAKDLSNVARAPNGNSSLRRDIVATNQATGGFWKRIREDYSSRQIVFEVKNYENIASKEYSQVYTYLDKEYGNIGFIICRDKTPELKKNGELESFSEFYVRGKVIIKITANMIVKILSKLREPEKFDVGNMILANHLDNHIRLYAKSKLPKK